MAISPGPSFNIQPLNKPWCLPKVFLVDFIKDPQHFIPIIPMFTINLKNNFISGFIFRDFFKLRIQNQRGLPPAIQSRQWRQFHGCWSWRWLLMPKTQVRFARPQVFFKLQLGLIAQWIWQYGLTSMQNMLVLSRSDKPT